VAQSRRGASRLGLRKPLRARIGLRRVELPDLPKPDPQSMQLTLRKGFGGRSDRFDPSGTTE